MGTGTVCPPFRRRTQRNGHHRSVLRERAKSAGLEPAAVVLPAVPRPPGAARPRRPRRIAPPYLIAACTCARPTTLPAPRLHHICAITYILPTTYLHRTHAIPSLHSALQSLLPSLFPLPSLYCFPAPSTRAAANFSTQTFSDEDRLRRPFCRDSLSRKNIRPLSTI